MNSKGQGFLSNMVLAFLLGGCLLVMSLALIPYMNQVFDKFVPSLNGMANFNIFATIMMFIPVLIVIFFLFAIVQTLQGRQEGV